MRSKNNKKYFKCNHLNGFRPQKITDKHSVDSVKDFEYLKTLPEFVFGNCIALEMYNSIEEQLKFKKYLSEMLNKHFN